MGGVLVQGDLEKRETDTRRARAQSRPREDTERWSPLTRQGTRP